MHPALANLRSTFERHRDRPWIFLRPLGNWGDDLIFAGAERLADSIGLRWQSFETQEFAPVATTPEHCIYLQGGGGYNSWCSGRAFVNLGLAAARPVALVVQGPVSVAGEPGWLAERFAAELSAVRCRELLFYAREDTTRRLLDELGLQRPGVTPALDDDTAFALGVPDLLALAELEAMPAGAYDLVVMREDNERPDREPESGDRSVPPGIVLDPARVADSFRHWLRIHLCARSIVTNRLHSAICGAIAGKAVAIGPGSYHKNRSVWEYSLRDRGVAWRDGIGSRRSPLWQALPRRLRESYKLRQVRLALHGVPLQ